MIWCQKWQVWARVEDNACRVCGKSTKRNHSCAVPVRVLMPKPLRRPPLRLVVNQ